MESNVYELCQLIEKVSRVVLSSYKGWLTNWFLVRLASTDVFELVGEVQFHLSTMCGGNFVSRLQMVSRLLRAFQGVGCTL